MTRSPGFDDRTISPCAMIHSKGPSIASTDAMRKNRLLTAGITGTVIAALCCFTPVLVTILGAIGLSAWLGWLDYLLLPALAGFLLLTVYAILSRRRGDPG